MEMPTSSMFSTIVVMAATAASSPINPAVPMSVSMGDGTCKLSMLLNWNTIDACFLFPTLQIKSPFGFAAACVGTFLLVLSLEFLRRLQRQFDRYLQSRNKHLKKQKYVVAEEMEEKLLQNENGEDAPTREKRLRITETVVLEQLARGLIHMAQFAISYCIMLLFMYSNGYIILSILVGALFGFALFTRDTLNNQSDQYDIQAMLGKRRIDRSYRSSEPDTDERNKTCC